MHEHDYEIIMALAEGTLDDVTAERAAADIAACAECTADLELQRLAISALNDAPDVYLTATESASLHANLKRELSIATPKAAPARQPIAWGRWLGALGAAAVLVFFIALIPMMGGIGGFSADDAEEAAALETTAAASETTAAPEMAEAPAAGATADDGSFDALTQESDLESAATEAPATTEAAAEETTTTNTATRSFTEGLMQLGPIAELDRDELLDRITIERELLMDETALALSVDQQFRLCLVETTTPDIAAELGLPADSDVLILGIVGSDIGEELVLVAFTPQPVSLTAFTTYRIAGSTCELVEVLP